MDLVMDRLSVVLLVAITVLAAVHLVLLRKPDPATHPLILGRQSDVDKVASGCLEPSFRIFAESFLASRSDALASRPSLSRRPPVSEVSQSSS